MDRGLEKINELVLELDKLMEQTSKIQKSEEQKMEEKFWLYQDIDILIQERKGLEEEKKELIYIQKNIKHSKKINIFLTISFLIMTLAPMFLLINPNPMIVKIFMAIISILASCGIIYVHDTFGDYGDKKKYLENHKMEDLEKEIEENAQEISLTNRKIKVTEKELNELSINKQDLKNNIKLLSQEIEKIKDIRNNIINEYLENNNEIEHLLNDGYDSFNKEKVKQNKGMEKNNK